MLFRRFKTFPLFIHLMLLGQLTNCCGLLPEDTRAKTYYVRNGTGLGQNEIKALYTKLPKVTNALNKLLGQSIKPKEAPLIGLACSGGGYRAMIATTGFMRGLEKAGILDSCMYLATLSGSTWMASSWLAQDLSLTNFRAFLKDQVNTDLADYDFDVLTIAETIATKIFYQQPVSFADVYGAMLGNILFDRIVDGGQDVYLSQLAPKIGTGDYPIPLFTSVLDYDWSTDYYWFEYSPYEVGCEKLKSWIPTEAFGKKFNAGISTDQAPEQTLGFMVGIFGSAFAANLREILEELANNIFKTPSLTKSVRDLRFSPPQVFSFTKNLDQSGFASEDRYTLVDAGLDFNVPFPPLLRRPVDIIIVCDASGDLAENTATALVGAQEYAEREGIAFPPISYTGIGKKPVSVFVDEKNPDAPVVIYFPNQVSFPTTKNRYTEKEFDLLSNSMEKAVIDNKNVIINAIKNRLVALKNGRTKKLPSM